MEQDSKRRVVITGLGAVAPNGIGVEAFWQATCQGISGIASFPYDAAADAPGWVAGTIPGFVIEDYVERKLANRTARMTHFALAAIQEALAAARLEMEDEDPKRMGAVIANTLGGVDFVLRQMETLYSRGLRFVSAYTAIAWLSVANVGQAAIRHNIQGYCKTPVNDTVSGLNALGMAYAAIRRGVADVILAGGCEAFLHPLVLLVLTHHGQSVLGEDPKAYRPFDRRASGLILAEGAGICVLEEYEHAVRRGAPIYGEIVGYAHTNDAHGLRSPSSDGTHYARAMSVAMRQGQLDPQEIAYVSLDGRAIPSSDLGEAQALHMALGPEVARIPMSVPRTMLGHSYAAAGAIDTIAAVLTLKDGIVPPTMNCEEMDPGYDLNLVRDEARPLHYAEQSAAPQVALVGGRGLGGSNVVLALKKGNVE